jgi:RNA polymerase sigma-70 factor, ECF subfamily
MTQAEFLRLIEDNKGILYKVCAIYCADRGDREDLMQEMIYQLWRSASAGNYDKTRKFSTYMYRIALNVAISFYRKAGRSGVKVSLESEMQVAESGPEDGLHDTVEILHRFIAGLGELDKALMILYLEERSYKEIAEVLGLTETNVATKLSRIKDRLKQRFLDLAKS